MCFIKRIICNETVFYVCDLKFDNTIRGKKYMIKILARSIPICLMHCKKFYAISMNGENKENNILKMAKHMGNKYGVNIEYGGTLNIYTVDYDSMCNLHNLICIHKKQQIKYISLNGIKDLIIKNKKKNYKQYYKQYYNKI